MGFAGELGLDELPPSKQIVKSTDGMQLLKGSGAWVGGTEGIAYFWNKNEIPISKAFYYSSICSLIIISSPKKFWHAFGSMILGK